MASQQVPLTTERVCKLLTEHVSQQTILAASEHNLFGVGKDDCLEEAKKNVALIKAIFNEHAYPKLTILESGFRQWATNLAGPFLSKDSWYFKHQAYALFQQLARLRKLSNNIKDGTRVDPILKDVVNFLKDMPKRQKAKKVSQPTAKPESAGQKMRRAILRRLSSSPTPNVPQLSETELQGMFGVPLDVEVISSESEAMGSEDLEAQAEADADLALKLWAEESGSGAAGSGAASSGSVVAPVQAALTLWADESGSGAAGSGAASSGSMVPPIQVHDEDEEDEEEAPLVARDPSKPFWSAKDQKMLVVLPSGQTMEVPTLKKPVANVVKNLLPSLSQRGLQATLAQGGSSLQMQTPGMLHI